jgi:hypothetical protein
MAGRAIRTVSVVWEDPPPSGRCFAVTSLSR